MTLQMILAACIFVAAYALIASEKIPRVAVALGGASAMVVIGATGDHEVFFSEKSGIDWNVIFLLVGMMIIVGIMRQTGIFEFLAVWAAKAARGRPFRIMVMLVVITAVLSAFLDNVTTVLLIAPVTFVICRRLDVVPVPFLIAEVMASNIGGTATLIGDPPNIIVASRSGLSFNDFLVNLTPLVAIILIVFLVMSRIMFRRSFRYDPSRAADVMALRPGEAITDVRLLVKCLVVLGLVLAGFILNPLLGFEPAVVALLGAGLLAALARLEPGRMFGDIEWETLLFFAGLFIMVGSLVNLGIIKQIGHVLSGLVGHDYLAASIGMLLGSAIVSGIVDNIPYVATLAPITADLVHAGGAAAQPLWWALTLGADLGGNATAIGASANVVVIGMAKREGHPITFWQFTKYGLITTAVTVAVCVPYLWLRYFL